MDAGANLTVEQISVFVANKAGQLGDVTRVLHEAGVNIRALALSDMTDFGVLRLMADDVAKAREVLQKAGFTVGTAPVVAVEVSDRPGGLSGILTLLSQHGINVEYLYCYTQRDSSKATLVFRFDSNSRAIDVLQTHGVHVLTPEEVAD